MSKTRSESKSKSKSERPELVRMFMVEADHGGGGIIDSPVQNALAELLLRDAVREGASDLHLDPMNDGLHIRLRIDGALHDAVTLPMEDGRRLVNQFKTMAGLDPIVPQVPEESRRTQKLEDRELNLRIIASPCVGGEKLTIRLLDPVRVGQKIHDLGITDAKLEQIDRWLDTLSGIFLVVGPTGAGKTTTLYALLQELLPLRRSIVTIEDPVEYHFEGATQMQVNEARGLDFAAGVKAMLRLDPDYLLVGEIRGVESARAVANVAVSGRVVLSTIHNRDAVGAVASLRNWGLEDYEICAALAIVVAQRLVRKLFPECRKEEPPTEQESRWLSGLGLAAPDRLWHAVGCDECGGIGYKGRTGVFEVWRLIDEDYDAITRHADERELRNMLADREHSFLLPDALEKVLAGITTLDELKTMGGVGPVINRTVPAAFRQDKTSKSST